jgi:hypothetical protein
MLRLLLSKYVLNCQNALVVEIAWKRQGYLLGLTMIIKSFHCLNSLYSMKAPLVSLILYLSLSSYFD